MTKASKKHMTNITKFLIPHLLKMEVQDVTLSRKATLYGESPDNLTQQLTHFGH